MSDPIIGIPTQHIQRRGAILLAMSSTYCRAIEAAGGVPLLIPLVEQESALRRLYGIADGLLLGGGGDVVAEAYGAADSGRLTFVDRERDRVELALSRWALQENLPILGICRGIQVLNVAAGGTLIQDIPSEMSDPFDHYTLPADQPCHEVRIEPRSLLANALGIEAASASHPPLSVNSTHHQAVKQVAPGFRITAHASDGVIEGIEKPRDAAAFVLGVQWHPERLVPGDVAMVRLFRAFIRACR